MKDVFLSHASADKETCVRPLAAELAKAGITYWLDEAEIGWGDSIAKKINEGLVRSKYVVVFLSASFIGRRWTETELFAVLHRQVEEGRTRVLPIVVGDPAVVLKPYPLLAGLAYKPWSLGGSALAAAITTQLEMEKTVIAHGVDACLRQYCACVTQRDLESAYRCFAPAFQATTSLAAYADVFGKTQRAELRDCELINHHEGHAYCQVTVAATGENQETEIWRGSVELSRDGDQWRIHTMKGLKHYPA